MAARVGMNVHSVFDLQVGHALGFEGIPKIDYRDTDAADGWEDIVESLRLDSGGDRSRNQNDDHLSSLCGGMVPDLLQGPLRYLKVKGRQLSHEGVHMVRGLESCLGIDLPQEVVLGIDSLQLQSGEVKARGRLFRLRLGYG